MAVSPPIQPRPLSPFPAFPTDRTVGAEFGPWAAAVDRLVAAVGCRGDGDAMGMLGLAASALVEKEAPDAPQAAKDEAVIRIVGYWAQSDFGGIESETSVGGKAASYFRPAPSAFRYSGAKGMLSPWKKRRARAVA